MYPRSCSGVTAVVCVIVLAFVVEAQSEKDNSVLRLVSELTSRNVTDKKIHAILELLEGGDEVPTLPPQHILTEPSEKRNEVQSTGSTSDIGDDLKDIKKLLQILSGSVVTDSRESNNSGNKESDASRVAKGGNVSDLEEIKESLQNLSGSIVTDSSESNNSGINESDVSTVAKGGSVDDLTEIEELLQTLLLDGHDLKEIKELLQILLDSNVTPGSESNTSYNGNKILKSQNNETGAQVPSFVSGGGEIEKKKPENGTGNHNNPTEKQLLPNDPVNVYPLGGLSEYLDNITNTDPNKENLGPSGNDETKQLVGNSPNVDTETGNSGAKSKSSEKEFPDDTHDSHDVDSYESEPSSNSSQGTFALLIIIFGVMLGASFVAFRKRRRILIYLFEKDKRNRRGDHTSRHKYKLLPSTIKEASS